MAAGRLPNARRGRGLLGIATLTVFSVVAGKCAGSVPGQTLLAGQAIAWSQPRLLYLQQSVACYEQWQATRDVP